MQKQSDWSPFRKKLYAFLEKADKSFIKFGTLFLLLFIPLYPKIPLIDVWQSWVFIRIEDLLVTFLGLFFVIETMRKHTKIKSPLTIPIALYWIIGAVTVLHAILVYAPAIAEVFGHLVILHYFRRIEYMLLFFIALNAIKREKDVKHISYTFFVMLSFVVAYGFGQKFFQFPAFLTMNEEFAKGAPLVLSPDSRISSTFAGHYDLAAFLVFAGAFIASLFFGLKGILKRAGLAFLGLSSVVLLMFTKSRISFIALAVSFFMVLALHKKKWLIIPFIVIGVLFMFLDTGISDRFKKTVRIQPVVYNLRTRKPVSTLDRFSRLPSILKVLDAAEIKRELVVGYDEDDNAFYEELPLGSGYINTPLLYTYGTKPRPLEPSELYRGENELVASVASEFEVKDTLVYDISFTTRSQGQWPRAIAAFNRNKLIGSGFSSIDVATDNDYLRMLGETGLLGFFAFLSIIASFLLLVRIFLKHKTSSFSRSFMIGAAAGIVGIMINGILIDVFEASKLAFVLWIMVGTAVGLFMLTVKQKVSLVNEAISVLKSRAAAAFLIIMTSFFLLQSSFNSFFIADDFTWLVWARDTSPSDILRFFVDSDGFFYRPVIKALMFALYMLFDTVPVGYHVVSFLFHTIATLLVYAITRTISKNWFVALLTSVLFLIHPIHAENILWISGYSGQLAAVFYFSSFYAFLLWLYRKKKGLLPSAVRRLLYVLSILLFALSVASYELAITLPLAILLALLLLGPKPFSWARLLYSIPYWVAATLYLYVRNSIASSHPLSGDYSYNISKALFNVPGNIAGYAAEMIVGMRAVPYYDALRSVLREQPIIAAIIITIILLILSFIARKANIQAIVWDKRILFGIGWFVATLGPVVGLGNIAERYLYIPSFGAVFAFSLFVYAYFVANKKLSRKTIGIVLVVFVLALSYLEFQRVKIVWKQSSYVPELVYETLAYNHLKFPESSTIYFVHVPIRNERAWVYPVGLSDTVELLFPNKNIKVFRTESEERAINAKRAQNNVFIYIYEDGVLKERFGNIDVPVYENL